MMPPLRYRILMLVSLALLVVNFWVQDWLGVATCVGLVIVARLLAIGWVRSELAIRGKLTLPPFELGHLGGANYRISRSQSSGEIIGVELWQPVPDGGWAYTASVHPDPDVRLEALDPKPDA